MTRAAAWRLALDAARARLVDLEWVDGTDDVAIVREQLVRTRLAASVERQAHESRAVVIDVEHSATPGGLRLIVAVPTGDRGELREAMVMAIAAMQMANDDVDAMRACADRLRADLAALRVHAQRCVDAQYPGDMADPPDLRTSVSILSGYLNDTSDLAPSDTADAYARGWKAGAAERGRAR